MFTSPAFSHSSRGTLGGPFVFGQGNQKVDATWAFAQTSSPSSSTTIGAPSPYSLGSSTSGGSNATRSTFDLQKSHFGGQDRGSRITNYKATFADKYSEEKLVSISAMPVYEAKSHEELRWEDYKSPEKDGFGPSSSVVKSTSSSLSPFSSSSFTNFSTNSWGTTFVSTTPTTPNPFSKTIRSVDTETPTWSWNKFPGPSSTSQPSFTSSPLNSFNPFLPRTNLTSPASSASTSFKSPTFTSPWSTSESGSLAPLNQNPFTNPFTSLPTQTSSSSYSSPTFTPFVTPSSSSYSSPTFAPLVTPCYSSPTFAPLVTPSSSSYSSPTFAPFVTPSSSSGSSPTFAPFVTPSSSSGSSPTFAPFVTPSSSSGFWPTQILTSPANSLSSGLSSTFNQPTTLFPSSFNTSASWSHAPLNQNLITNPFTSLPIKTCSLTLSEPTSSALNYNGATTGIIGQITSKDQTSSAPNPFGTLPPKPHLSFECSQSTQSIQYGISSIPVKDKPATVKYPLLTTRHLPRRNKLPVLKYNPKVNGLKMPFFSDTEEIPVAAFVQRENPRALVITGSMHEQKLSDSTYGNEKDDIKVYETTKEKNKFPSVLDVPLKLQHPDYYTKPRISELESKERAEPGFCSHVNDFVIGRHGYGSIKFLGETDVRKLDLESFVQFNNREVIVYMDDTKKPPIGQGLNNPAEITLLNIKCIDKKSGVEYTDGLKIDKYIEMLKKKVVAQGAEFISYDPVEGEWKFRVQHF